MANYAKPKGVWPNVPITDEQRAGWQKQMNALTRGSGSSVKAIMASGEMYQMKRDAACYERPMTEHMQPPSLDVDQVEKP